MAFYQINKHLRDTHYINFNVFCDISKPDFCNFNTHQIVWLDLECIHVSVVLKRKIAEKEEEEKAHEILGNSTIFHVLDI